MNIPNYPVNPQLYKVRTSIFYSIGLIAQTFTSHEEGESILMTFLFPAQTAIFQSFSVPEFETYFQSFGEPMNIELLIQNSINSNIIKNLNSENTLEKEVVLSSLEYISSYFNNSNFAQFSLSIIQKYIIGELSIDSLNPTSLYNYILRILNNCALSIPESGIPYSLLHFLNPSVGDNSETNQEYSFIPLLSDLIQKGDFSLKQNAFRVIASLSLNSLIFHELWEKSPDIFIPVIQFINSDSLDLVDMSLLCILNILNNLISDKEGLDKFFIILENEGIYDVLEKIESNEDEYSEEIDLETVQQIHSILDSIDST